MKTRLTLKSVRTELKAHKVVIKKTADGEYRVCKVGGSEDSAYYTDDLEDALITGKVLP